MKSVGFFDYRDTNTEVHSKLFPIFYCSNIFLLGAVLWDNLLLRVFMSFPIVNFFKWRSDNFIIDLKQLL